MPPLSLFFSAWTVDPVAIAGLIIAGGLYCAGIVAAARRGISWPIRRTLAFYALGLSSYSWLSLGFLAAYSVDLRWAFTTRIALLLLVVPALMSLGRPVALARAALGQNGVRRLDGFLNSRPIRFTGNAVFEPLFSLVLFLAFLTTLAGIVRTDSHAQWAMSLLLPVIGLLTIVPIFENTARHTSFFVMVEFVLAFAAFLFDSIPGIVLRLSDTVLDGISGPAGAVPQWFPSPLRDQQLSGDLLWFLAELLDVPILIILIIRWNRIDRGEAKSLDALSDEEMALLTEQHLRGRRE
ncbi:MAG: cytochrome c oxidase assembly protein [Rhodoglobus sp.]